MSQTPISIEMSDTLSLEDQMQLAMQQVVEGKVFSMDEFLATL